MTQIASLLAVTVAVSLRGGETKLPMQKLELKVQGGVYAGFYGTSFYMCIWWEGGGEGGAKSMHTLHDVNILCEKAEER